MLSVTCADDYVPCCDDLWNVASWLLAHVGDALDPCLVGAGCAPLPRYVTMGAGDDGVGDKLNVGINSVAPSPASTVNGRTLPFPIIRAEFVVRLHESGWPTIQRQGDLILAPPPEDQAKAARQALAHAEMMYRTLTNLNATRRMLPPTVRGCGNPLLGPLTPVPPRGGVIGWTASVTVDVAWGGG